MLVELRCTSCNAPMDASQAGVLRCKYCGAAFVVREPVAERTKEVFAVSFIRVGPSNRARVAHVVQERVGIDLHEAERLADHAPCEIIAWDDLDRALALKKAIVDAGASAEVVTRTVAMPATLPKATVLLEGIGPNKLAVIKVVREHLDLGIAEAKHLVESTPCVLVEAIEGGRAKAIRAALVTAGAKVKIEGAR